jgi:hypothetical protein
LCIHGCDGWERVISCTNCVIFFTCFKLGVGKGIPTTQAMGRRGYRGQKQRSKRSNKREYIFFGGLECVGHSLAYIAHLKFFIFWILRAGVLSHLSTQLIHPSHDLASIPHNLATHPPQLSYPSPSTQLSIPLNLAIHIPQLSLSSPTT